MKVFLIELIKFIKNNFWKVLLITSIFTIVLTGREYFNRRMRDDKLESIRSDSNIEVNIQNVAPASFQFYIEDEEDGSVFFNNVLIEEYITLNYVLEEVAKSTGSSIDRLVEETNNEIIPSTQTTDRVKIIHVNRDPSSNLQAIYVNVGNEQLNLEIINYFYNFIQDGSIPFLEDKEVFIFKMPYIVNLNEDEDAQNIEAANSSRLIRTGILSTLIGFVLSIGILILLNIFSRTLNYYFFYTIFDEDYFVLVEDRINYEEEITNFLSYPNNKNTVVLQQDNLKSVNQKFDSYFKKLLNINQVEQKSYFTSLNNPDTIDQLIYLVNEGQTTREWYNKQRKLERLYKIPVMLIQVNKSKK